MTYVHSKAKRTLPKVLSRGKYVSLSKRTETLIRSFNDTNIPKKLLIIALVCVAARQKNDSGTSAAFHPRKQCLTEGPVLVLYAKTEKKKSKIYCVLKKRAKSQQY